MDISLNFSKKNDTINMPRVEHATMRLAACAGLTVATTRVEVINGKDALFVTRFDIVKGVPCRQLLSFDTLLKGQANEYGDLANVLIKQVSTSRLAYCLEQLFRQMCINICINNTDDHLKNFSLLRDENGWCLSPAYDLVPSLSVGEYHQMGFAYSAVPPRGDQLITYGVNRFHLRDSQARQIIDEVQVAVANWREEFIQLGVVEDDIEFLNKVIEPRLK